MSVFIHHNDLTVEILDDSKFIKTAGSSTYDIVIQAAEDKQYSPNSKHAIKVYKGGKLIKRAIILASGGATCVHENIALADEGNLIISCCNKLFSLTLPNLDVNWVAEPDWATCFSVYKYNDTYITHGETSIARTDRTGKILWRYGGADIFVCLYEGNPFEMHDDYIELTDFAGSKYKINYNGETINYEPSDFYKQEPVAVTIKPKKQWWKFW